MSATAYVTRKRRRLARALIAVLSTLLLAGLLAAAASAAAPSLSVDSTSNTTVAPDSDLDYFITVTNLGDAPTDGSEINLTIALPEHVTALSVPRLKGWLCEGQGGSPLAGASTVTCTNPKVIGSPDINPLILTAHVDDEASEGDVLSSSLQLSGGGAPPASTVDPTTISATPPDFGIDAFDEQPTDQTGAPYTRAAGHPYATTTAFDFNTMFNPALTAPSPPYNQFIADLWPVEPTRDAVVDLPPGSIGNPSVLTQCTATDLAVVYGLDGAPLCAPSSQVGVAVVRLSTGKYSHEPPFPVFNIVPPPGVPARFGFNVFGISIILDAHLRAGGDYGLSVGSRNIPTGLPVAGNTITFWGVPADPSHDALRWCPEGTPRPCSAEVEPRAFLRAPTSCSGPTTSTLHIDSWFHSAAFDAEGFPDLGDPLWQSQSIHSHLPPGYPANPLDPSTPWGEAVGQDHCQEEPFEPQISVQPTNPHADAPTGLEVVLTMPQLGLEDPAATASESDLRKAVVTLPEGMAVNPASAGGLSGCSAEEIGLKTDVGETPIHFSGLPDECPDAAKIGIAQIETPLLDHPLKGAVYLAKQSENPFGSLLAFYLAFDDPASGIVIKLAGHVEADPTTGQLTTVFDENPQLPFAKLHLELKSGPRAPLVNPPACGTYAAEATLTPWSHEGTQGEEGTPIAQRSSSFTITQGPSGGPCPSKPPAFAPKFSGGTQNPLAATYSPFSLRLTREDATQRLAGLDVSLPPGLVGRLAGIPYCSDAALNSIPSGDSSLGMGAAQLANPGCPAASQLGSVTVGAGAGPTPFFTQSGRAYLAGPYKGAPLSLAVVTPAIAGPFDLGSVVVRTALKVNPETVQIEAVSDPLPTILDGIPLDLRDVRVNVNRNQFTLNPTSCDPMAVTAKATSTLGASANLQSRFQVLGCRALGFKPRLSLTLKGHTARRGHPALRATLKMKAGQANIARAAVTLPPSELLDNAHIGSVCTRVRYAAGGGGGEQCPPASRLGFARAFTPLLDQPLEGPVYLRSSSHQLPDLVASLDGQIHIDLLGRIDSSRQGGLRTTFEAVPDAPVSKFVLTMAGGRRGLLQNSTDLCAATHHAIAKFDAQNGKLHDFKPLVRADCGSRKQRGKR